MPRGRSRAGGALGWDHRDDAALTQGKPDAAAAVGLVAGHRGGSQARPPPADAPDRAATDQGAHLRAVVNLATGQGEGDRLAVALTAQVSVLHGCAGWRRRRSVSMLRIRLHAA